MSDMITLACPSCSGNLRVTEDTDRFACPYCNRQHLIRRERGSITVEPFVKKLEQISDGVDRQSSEMAIRRLREDMSIVNRRIAEWKDEYRYTRTQHRRKRRSAISQLVYAVLSAACVVVTLSIGKEVMACGGVFLVLTLILGVAGLKGLASLSYYRRQTNLARQKLDKFYQRLEDLDAEYKIHMDIVRRR